MGQALDLNAEGGLRTIIVIFKFIETGSENVVEACMQRPLRLRAREDGKTKLKVRCIMTGIVGMQKEPTQATSPFRYGALKARG